MQKSKAVSDNKPKLTKSIHIAIDGGDFSGKSTQVKRLQHYYENKGYPVKVFKFPDYSTKEGQTILGYLKGEVELGDDEVVSLFRTDRLRTLLQIEQNEVEPCIYLFDRSYLSTVFQSSALSLCKKVGGTVSVSSTLPLSSTYALIDQITLTYLEERELGQRIPNLIILLGHRADSQQDIESRTGSDDTSDGTSGLDRYEGDELFQFFFRKGFELAPFITYIEQEFINCQNDACLKLDIDSMTNHLVESIQPYLNTSDLAQL